MSRLHDLKWKMGDLAERAGMTRQTISSIINQKQDGIRLSTRLEIAKALGISIEELETDPKAHSGCQAVISHLHSLIDGIPADILEGLKNADEAALESIRAVLGLAETPSSIQSKERKSR